MPGRSQKSRFLGKLGTGISLALVATFAGMVLQCFSGLSCTSDAPKLVDALDIGPRADAADLGLADGQAAAAAYGITTLSQTTNIDTTSVCNSSSNLTDIFSVTLPDANAKYLVTANIVGKLECSSSPGWVHTELWDEATGTMISESEQILFATSAALHVGSSSNTVLFQTTGSGQKVTLKACYGCSGTLTTAAILSSANGRSKIVWQRVQ
jgi:hypothetical protein